MQPIGDTAAAGTIPPHIVRQRHQPLLGGAPIQTAQTASTGDDGQRRRRRIMQPFRGSGDIVHHHGVHAVTQHAFQRDIPTGCNFQVLPQPRQAGELVLLEPGFELLVLI